jgi:hypothetical protein
MNQNIFQTIVKAMNAELKLHAKNKLSYTLVMHIIFANVITSMKFSSFPSVTSMTL